MTKYIALSNFWLNNEVITRDSVVYLTPEEALEMLTLNWVAVYNERQNATTVELPSEKFFEPKRNIKKRSK